MRAPYDVHDCRQHAPAGTASESFVEDGPTPTGTPGTPVDGDDVSSYRYVTSLGLTPESTITGKWGYNTVMHSKGTDVGLAGHEVDVQNETAAPSHTPCAMEGPRYSKTAFTAVIGPSFYDTTAAFAATLNYPHSHAIFGPVRWVWGFVATGCRKAGYAILKKTNQNGDVHPAAGIYNDTDAPVLIDSIGVHDYVLRSWWLNLHRTVMQLGSSMLGLGRPGPRVEVGRNLSGSGAPGCFLALDAQGRPWYLWPSGREGEPAVWRSVPPVAR